MPRDDYFTIVYKILRTLRAALRVEEFDNEQISHEVLHINLEYWERILLMMSNEGYISGVEAVHITGRPFPGVKLMNIAITEKGLVYLQENSMMKKAARMAKGIIGTIK